MAPSIGIDPQASRLPAILEQHESVLLTQWLSDQLAAPAFRKDLMKEAELREQSRQFLAAFRGAVQRGDLSDIGGQEWSVARGVLADISRTRAAQGFTSSETALFVLSLRPALLDRLQQAYGTDTAGLAADTRVASTLLDKLGLYTVEIHQKCREEIIKRQQQEMLELSTPVVRLFEGILAVPLIGTLDSARTQVVMEALLQRIVETGAQIAIIDITGVPTVDTLVAQHLLKTVSAARLMGAECIISGIRPQIAQTIVHLGLELQNVKTKATMADAFTVALRRTGLTISRAAAPPQKADEK